MTTRRAFFSQQSIARESSCELFDNQFLARLIGNRDGRFVSLGFNLQPTFANLQRKFTGSAGNSRSDLQFFLIRRGLIGHRNYQTTALIN